MTSPYVSFQQPSAARRSAWPVLRVILSIAAVLIGILGFMMAGFAGIVTWTGCFIECSGENHPAGAGLMLLAVALLAGGPAVVAALYRSRAWLVVTCTAAAVGAVLLAWGLSTT